MKLSRDEQAFFMAQGTANVKIVELIGKLFKQLPKADYEYTFRFRDELEKWVKMVEEDQIGK